MAIPRVGGACVTEGGDRRVVLVEPLADFAEREPRRGEIRRQFRRLQQQIGGGGQIAFNCRSRANSNRRSAIMSPEERNRRAGIGVRDRL
jgi:hypothetical protein